MRRTDEEPCRQQVHLTKQVKGTSHHADESEMQRLFTEVHAFLLIHLPEEWVE